MLFFFFLQKFVTFSLPSRRRSYYGMISLQKFNFRLFHISSLLLAIRQSSFTFFDMRIHNSTSEFHNSSFEFIILYSSFALRHYSRKRYGSFIIQHASLTILCLFDHFTYGLLFTFRYASHFTSQNENRCTRGGEKFVAVEKFDGFNEG